MADTKPQLVPIEAVAKHLSVSISTVRVWIRKKLIPANTYIKVGTTYRFNLNAVEEALRHCEPDIPDEEIEVWQPEPTREPIKLYSETED